MAQYIEKIRTESGDLQIDYNALANLPQSDKTLSKDGSFADAKATGDAIKKATIVIDNTLTNAGQAADAQVTGTKFQTLETSISDANTAIASVKETADNALPKSGGEVSGDINMGDHNITNLSTPVNAKDAVNKEYVDEKYFTGSVALSSSGWVGDTAPYTQTVSLDGILEADNPHYGVIYSGTVDNKLAQKEAFSLIDELTTADESLTFICFDDKPTVDLDIQLEVNR